MRVFMLPRWIKCSLARIGAVKVGAAACPFSVCTIHRLQSQAVQESGPLEGVGATPGVPYQAMSTRPIVSSYGPGKHVVMEGAHGRTRCLNLNWSGPGVALI